VEPDIVQYGENRKPQYDLILGIATMKELGIIVDFKAKMITIDEVKLQMQNIKYLQGASALRALKLNHSLAMEPHSTQDTAKMCNMDPRCQISKSRSPVNFQRQLQALKCQSAKEVTAAPQEI
jgi:hypothetical protein